MSDRADERRALNEIIGDRIRQSEADDRDRRERDGMRTDIRELTAALKATNAERDQLRTEREGLRAENAALQDAAHRSRADLLDAQAALDKQTLLWRALGPSIEEVDELKAALSEAIGIAEHFIFRLSGPSSALFPKDGTAEARARLAELQRLVTDETQQSTDLDQDRCAVCGWPLAHQPEGGCVRGDCSERPRPKQLYDAARAAKESTT